MSKRTAAEQTAFGPMVIAACEQYTAPAQRLVDDDLALRFLPAGQRLRPAVVVGGGHPVRSWTNNS